MNARIAPIARTALAAAATLVLAAAVPAAAAGPQAKPGRAVVLEYKMPAGRSLTYKLQSAQTQVMEVQGQAMDTKIASTNTVTFKSKGMKDKNLLLGVTIDEMASTVTNSMQGDMSPDFSQVKGKSFDMVLSPLGSEVDVSGAEAITFSTAAETRDVSAQFKAFFPDLPGKPVKVGDTWPSSASLEQKSAAMSVRADSQYVNTFEGLETVDGMECARISSQVTGTVTGTGNQMGMDLTMSGTSKGKTVWYFAVKEGIFVKSADETTSEISIDVSGAGMTIPMSQTSKSEITLAGKS
ncbi:MAG: hypothetical protein ABFD52_10175 [Acidobacteriota bacterium]